MDSITLHSRDCACLYICGLIMYVDSTCPFYLSVSGRLVWGGAGTAAAAGSGGSCRHLKNALLRCCLGCYVDCAWPSQKEKNRHGMKWPYSHRFCSAGRPGGSGTGGAPTAAQRLCCWTASHALPRVCLYVVSECAPTRRVPSSAMRDDHIHSFTASACTTTTSPRSTGVESLPFGPIHG